MDRRRLAVGGAAAFALSRAASAANRYPVHNIDFIIPNAPGGGADLLVRMMAGSMEKKLQGVHVLPVNIDAGGGGKSIIELYRAKPDGYTIGLLNIPALYVLQTVRNLKQDFTRFTWLGSITRGEPYSLAVRAQSPIRSIADLEALSRRRPITFSSTGPEGTAYLSTVVACHILGLRIRLVSGYRGSSDYIVGAMRGDADAVVAARSTLHRMAKGGLMRVLATFTSEKTPPGVENSLTLGQPELSQLVAIRMIGAPPGLPQDRKAFLADMFARVLREPQITAWARRSGEVVDPKGPEQAAAIALAQKVFFEKWKPFLAAA